MTRTRRKLTDDDKANKESHRHLALKIIAKWNPLFTALLVSSLSTIMPITSILTRQPMGSFERFLLTAPDKAIDHALMAVPAWMLPVFGRLNTRLRHWYYGYTRRTWDFEQFVNLFVPRAATLLALIDGRNAMIYGIAVLRFLLRCPSTRNPLDICTTLSRYHQLNRVLEDDGFKLIHPHSMPGQSMQDTIGNILQRVGIAHTAWTLAEDRSSVPEEHIGYKFQYRRKCKGEYIVVNLHLIRCEPYRHVLGGCITPLTCYMTGLEAGSPFARTTFRYQLGFALRNHTFRDIGQATVYEVHAPDHTHRFETVLGPPYAFNTHVTAETGCRRFGDDRCWTIPRQEYGGTAYEATHPDPMHTPTPRKGQVFEVLDWNMVSDRKGTYLSIGEPFVWRYYFAKRFDSADQEDEEDI
ncbi:hypothetical protein DFP72DRAFT_859644 [Ephemerocybe angulata]|uniref:Uncharacterized protein n=1 Tax=Ephemerocybe angulata TaxID=980116 RepID=A0A8H6LVS6_9AGAR|nr:hypothetical protein DFP72DRAFT_859644 [Tulosesus angulatus]